MKVVRPYFLPHTQIHPHRVPKCLRYIGLAIGAAFVLFGLTGCAGMKFTGSLSYSQDGKSIVITSDGKTVNTTFGVKR